MNSQQVHETHRHHSHDHPGCCHAHTGQPFDSEALISARSLVAHRTGKSILTGVDIDIKDREIVTLIGPNGAGKTTLVRILLGLEKPSSGEVRRRPGLRIGYVPQRFDADRAIPMTVARFLMLGTNATRDEVQAVLDEVGAGRIIDRQISRVSGGELQRAVLARALLRQPALLVLDEPLRGVDYTGEAELYALIAALRERRAIGVLLVSHDLHVVMASSDRVICLNHHVCCSGVPETVAQHPEYMRLFGQDSARAFGIYKHHHDHRHDLSGETAEGPDDRD